MLAFLHIFPCGGTFFFKFCLFFSYMRKLKVNAYSCSKKETNKTNFFLIDLQITESSQPALVPIELNS